MRKVLLVIGDGAEVIDTMVPLYRLAEDFEVITAGPAKRNYHLVQHHHDPGVGHHCGNSRLFVEIRYCFLRCEPGGIHRPRVARRAGTEFLRYDEHLIRITKHFFEHNKPVASICHGIEILAAADVIRGRRVTTIPRCRLDAEFSGATYVAEGLVIDGNLYCCRFKKECAPWMKAFVAALRSTCLISANS